MNIKDVQKINLKLLKEFDKFCNNHNIKYRLEAGTLLGAIRHKGFIPWDDDCDVVLKREEFEKLLVALNNDELSDGFSFIKPYDYDGKHFRDNVYRIFYTKVIYRDKDIFFNWHNGYLKYLWLDIFVLDNIDEKAKNIHFVKLNIIYGMLLGHRYKINYCDYDNILKKIIIFLLSNIGKMFSLKYLLNKYNKLSIKYNHKNSSKLYYSNYPPIYFDYIMDVEDEEYIYVDFEDTKLPVPKNFDKVLKKLYGEYMKFPSKEKQIPEHFDITK